MIDESIEAFRSAAFASSQLGAKMRRVREAVVVKLRSVPPPPAPEPENDKEREEA